MSLLDKIVNLFQPAYPDNNLLPTILEGEIYGPIRCESMDGSEMYLQEDHDQTTSVKFSYFQPFQQNGKMWFVTHIQKKSKHGWIRTNPRGFHYWSMSQLPQKDINGNWIPGSESGIYYREPFSWRIDVPGTMIDGVLRHWIYTKGFLGRHFD